MHQVISADTDPLRIPKQCEYGAVWPEGHSNHLQQHIFTDYGICAHNMLILLLFICTFSSQDWVGVLGAHSCRSTGGPMQIKNKTNRHCTNRRTHKRRVLKNKKNSSGPYLSLYLFFVYQVPTFLPIPWAICELQQSTGASSEHQQGVHDCVCLRSQTGLHKNISEDQTSRPPSPSTRFICTTCGEWSPLTSYMWFKCDICYVKWAVVSTHVIVVFLLFACLVGI